MADTVRALKDEIVTAVAMHTLEPGAEPEPIPSIEIDVFPAELQWTADLPGYDPEADVVTQQWYYRGPEKLGGRRCPPSPGRPSPSPSTRATTPCAPTWPPRPRPRA